MNKHETWNIKHEMNKGLLQDLLLYKTFILTLVIIIEKGVEKTYISYVYKKYKTNLSFKYDFFLLFVFIK